MRGGPLPPHTRCINCNYINRRGIRTPYAPCFVPSVGGLVVFIFVFFIALNLAVQQVAPEQVRSTCAHKYDATRPKLVWTNITRRKGVPAADMCAPHYYRQSSPKYGKNDRTVNVRVPAKEMVTQRVSPGNVEGQYEFCFRPDGFLSAKRERSYCARSCFDLKKKNIFNV